MRSAPFPCARLPKRPMRSIEDILAEGYTTTPVREAAPQTERQTVVKKKNTDESNK
jgi:hypothetical protein